MKKPTRGLPKIAVPAQKPPNLDQQSSQSLPSPNLQTVSKHLTKDTSAVQDHGTKRCLGLDVEIDRVAAPALVAGVAVERNHATEATQSGGFPHQAQAASLVAREKGAVCRECYVPTVERQGAK